MSHAGPVSAPAPAVARAATATHLFRGQAMHVFFLAVMLPVAWALAAPALGDGVWLGVGDATWFAICLAVAVLHQAYVWIAWRAQLGWSAFTRAFGDADFAVYNALFVPMLVARPVLLAATATADAGSLAMPARLATALGILVSVPALYTGWSVARYFGFARATGGDHFRRRYREMPLVREGVFAWTPNAMYTFAFLGLWAIALFWRSQVALVAALFQHAYIWIHYACTEEPDLELLHGAP
jgi:protein-S-isoprenylcysteine O-methyltransferase Ste14